MSQHRSSKGFSGPHAFPVIRPRTGIVAVATVVALVLVTSCSPDTPINNTSGKDSSGSSKSYDVTFVPGSTPNPFFDTIFRGMKASAAKLNLHVNYQGPATFDATKQTTVLNSVLAAKPDLLVVSPDDADAMRAPIERFLDAGIPVITVNGKLNDRTGIVSQISASNTDGGKVAGKAVAQMVHGGGHVAIINIASGSISTEQRIKGFRTAISSSASALKLAPVSNDKGTAPESQNAARALMLAYPDLRAIFGTTEVNVEGAAAAVAAAGKAGRVKVIGYDATPGEVKLLKNGTISALVVQNAYGMGVKAIRYANAYLRGHRRSIKNEVVFSNTLATKKNIKAAPIQRLLYAR